MDTLLFEFPAKADYLLSVRLLASSVGDRMELDLDEIEDLKSAAAEACLILMGGGGYGRIRCDLTLDGDSLSARMTGLDPRGGAAADNAEAELSRYMLEALMEDVAVEQSGPDTVTAVSFRKTRGWGQTL